MRTRDSIVEEAKRLAKFVEKLGLLEPPFSPLRFLKGVRFARSRAYRRRWVKFMLEKRLFSR